ncbi:RNB domain-containing ribonuclease [Nakamurella flavida]|uniref:RNB domain-containing ribonuclease n=1 Tax=Nakamurella flavida TaxID=363630 RepID=A0A938YND4_9ACTN|nr:RNB domain-containing ribonuclease [Nakamurella flavida]
MPDRAQGRRPLHEGTVLAASVVGLLARPPYSGRPPGRNGTGLQTEQSAEDEQDQAHPLIRTHVRAHGGRFVGGSPTGGRLGPTARPGSGAGTGSSRRSPVVVPRVSAPSVGPVADLDFAAVRADLGIEEDYPGGAVEEARTAAERLPAVLATLPDETAVPFVTVDPPGSRDLDQAVHLSRRDGGYRVRYAIADVASFVEPGGVLDIETWRRGATQYSPDRSVPLHPTELSEGAASLLPGVVRAAVLWTIDLDAAGEPVAVDVHRAAVRSVARLDYAGVQADLDAGRAHPGIELLPEIGALRTAIGRARHAITLDLPDIEVERGGDGHWTLVRRAVLPVEQANAEISLLTGTCAAVIMLRGLIGILRTLPVPGPEQVQTLRRATAALGIRWPAEESADSVIARMDGTRPMDAAFLEDAVRLLRGAGYTPFDGVVPEHTGHGGVGAAYAHVTAPLRRLVDRYGSEVCLALTAGTPVPDWVRRALPDLPAAMSAADRRSSALAKAVQGAVSTALLGGREGEVFPATVLQIDAERDRAVVVLHDPPVRANCSPRGLTEGTVVDVRLVSADPATHRFVVEPV